MKQVRKVSGSVNMSAQVAQMVNDECYIDSVKSSISFDEKFIEDYPITQYEH